MAHFDGTGDARFSYGSALAAVSLKTRKATGLNRPD